ncbi:MAG TPA: hypothetical protein VMF61_00975 [Candidatus Acidoferrales bacterium]|nr:hypothetical protein [Candidatus Acidoferrales bacterium]
MKKRWKRLAVVAGVLLAVYVGVEIYLAGGGALPPPPATIPLVMHGGHVVGNRIATKSWVFEYDHAQLDQDGTAGSVDGVRNGIVFRKGKPYLRISAQHVQVDLENLDFTAIGKVHVEQIGDPTHRSFDTDLVTWTNNAKTLRMEHPTYVHSGDQTLRIDGITVDFDENTIHFGKIEGGVQVRK